MSKLIIRAAYADMISPFQSAEEARYTLNGFHVEPHKQGGVLMVATDGHTLGAFHESEGVVEASRSDGDIWALSKEALKACKPKKRDDFARWLVILPTENGVYNLAVVFSPDAEQAELTAKDGSRLDLILHQGMIQPIDGTFPNYERVVPTEVFDGAKVPSAYNADYLAKFGRVSGYDFDGNGISGKRICLYAKDTESPAVVFTGRNDFFGVIMPIRSETHSSLPEWWIECKGEVEKAA